MQLCTGLATHAAIKKIKHTCSEKLVKKVFSRENTFFKSNKTNLKVGSKFILVVQHGVRGHIN